MTSALLLGISGGPAATASVPTGITTTVIVKVASRGVIPEVANEVRNSGGRVKRTYEHVLTGFAATLPARAVDALRHSPHVTSVTPDATTSASATEQSPPWGLDRTDQRALPLSSTYSYDTSGQGVTVYVIDTGIRFTHSQFGGRATSDYDFVDDDYDASDCAGHGTHVAGTIGGSTYGMAKAVKLVSLRVWGCDNRGSFSDMIAAVDWAVGHRQGPAVINISGGGGSYSLMDEAVARATAAGIPVVVAAMNDNTDACAVSPAESPTAITVAASDSTDARAYFSNYGPCVDLFAPGVSVLSSTLDSDTSSGYMSGTSMATPHVTGAVARYLQSHPADSVDQVTTALVTATTKGVVTDALSANSGLLYVAPPVTATVPGAPTGATAVAGNASAKVSWKAPGSDGGAAITQYAVVSSPGGKTAVVAGTARSATVSGLTNSTPYTFTVKATNAVGVGPASTPSNKVTPTTNAFWAKAPAAVSVVQASSTSATIKWSAPANPGDSFITGYLVSRDGTSSTGVGPTSVTVSSTARSYSFTGLVAGRTYNLSVAALNAAGTGRPSGAAIPLSSTAQFNAPSAVTLAQSASGVVKATWSPPTVLAGRTVTAYKLGRPATSSTAAFSTTVAATARSYSFTGLVTNVQYDFTVQAVTSAGAGPAARSSAVIKPYISSPSSVTTSQPSAGAGKITWAPPTTTSGQTITGYRVFRNSTDTAGVGPWAAMVPATSRSFTFTKLVVGRTYTLSVQAVTAATISNPVNASRAITY